MTKQNITTFFQSKLGKVSVAAVALLLVASLGVAYSSFINKPNDIAKAASNISLAPGQTGQFSIQYINAGDSSSITNALTTIFLNNKLKFLFLKE